MSLRVVSLNIECERHLGRFPVAVRKQRPHVALLQEVPQARWLSIATLLGMCPVAFLPMARRNPGVSDSVWGIACYATADVNIKKVEADLYASYGNTPVCASPDYLVNRYLQQLQVEHLGRQYTLLHTHFTWCPDGRVTDRQRVDFERMRKIIDKHPSFALFGDLNAPRGMNEVWDSCAKMYKDNIPPQVTTTLDPHLHRVGNLLRVVDMCFTRGTHRVGGVSVHMHMSDHKGICADIIAT